MSNPSTAPSAPPKFPTQSSAGVRGGIAAEADDCVGNFGGADGAVEGFDINFVRVIHGECADLVSAIKSSRAGCLATPSTDCAGNYGAVYGVDSDYVCAEDSCDPGRRSGKRERVGGNDESLDRAYELRIGGGGGGGGVGGGVRVGQ